MIKNLFKMLVGFISYPFLKLGILATKPFTYKVDRAFNRKKKEDAIAWEGSEERKRFIESMYEKYDN